MSFGYRAYGLQVGSNMELREFTCAEGTPDVTVELMEGAPPCDPGGSQGFVRFDRTEIIYVNSTVGVFRVAGGVRIEIWPAASADRAMLRFFVIGNLMAMLLYQRGRLVLHASCVTIGDGAVAFAGVSGAGKSTIAAAFDAAGYTILSDDVAAIDVGGGFEMPSGYPSFKVDQEAAAALGIENLALTPLHSGEPSKRGCGMRHPEGIDGSRSLKAVFVLEMGAPAGIVRVNGADAFRILIPHTFPTRMGRPGDSEHLRLLGELVREVPIFIFRRIPGLQGLAGQVGEIVGLMDEGRQCRDAERGLRCGEEGKEV